jgi:hypothetical protein
MLPRNLGVFDRITASYEKGLPDLDVASDRGGRRPGIRTYGGVR